jgi:hypothetical protein
LASEISLFSGYDQPENRTTNYCLLVLKMLYEENPKFLGEALSALAGEAVGESVGVRFRQQRPIGDLVADGHIEQQPFQVYIETKRHDWFDDRKLSGEIRDIGALHSGRSTSLLLALANFDADPGSRFPLAMTSGIDVGVGFRASTFEDFLAAVHLDHISKFLSDTLDDFREYLDSQDLLPSWKNRLDVVNCATTADRIHALGIYACPTVGGSYTHARARYFGIYRGKRATHVAEILAVVDVDADVNGTRIRWQNSQDAPSGLTDYARSQLIAWGDDLMPGRVFVLGRLHETNFEKDTPGGMFGSKKYFDISSLKPTSASELAEALKSRTWTDLNS